MYVGGLLFYCIGMTLMALTRARTSVIVFSWAAGVMYSTLFTMPYLLVSHYHSTGTVNIYKHIKLVMKTGIMFKNKPCHCSLHWTLPVGPLPRQRFAAWVQTWPLSAAWYSWLSSFFRYAWDQLWRGRARRRLSWAWQVSWAFAGHWVPPRLCTWNCESKSYADLINSAPSIQQRHRCT